MGGDELWDEGKDLVQTCFEVWEGMSCGMRVRTLVQTCFEVWEGMSCGMRVRT